MVAAVDPREPARQAGPVRPDPQIVRLVGAQRQQVVAGHDGGAVIAAGDPQPLGGDLDVGVQLPEMHQGRFRLGLSEVTFGVEDLAVEIR